jgi:hypothetical protein
MNKEAVKQIFEEVKENHRKLDSCSRHDFSIDLVPDTKWGKRYQCSRCRGIVDSLTKYWYEKGLKHATKKPGE